ncbi:hypothetical protein EVAR_103071_1 [Eumeta japonica]|uniref:Uncharacterized protein n=1 Tax=Eumeta variegata TaxID=151549 RepID=A0A4C1WMF3_EUMVA|nr:hypothetical protein EVAR_103071_1 [Eumeta japonica]
MLAALTLGLAMAGRGREEARSRHTISSQSGAIRQARMLRHALANSDAAQNVPNRPIKCHTLTKYGRDVQASVVSFRPANENSGGPLPSLPFPQAQSHPSDILFPPKRAVFKQARSRNLAQLLGETARGNHRECSEKVGECARDARRVGENAKACAAKRMSRKHSIKYPLKFRVLIYFFGFTLTG